MKAEMLTFETLEEFLMFSLDKLNQIITHYFSVYGLIVLLGSCFSIICFKSGLCQFRLYFIEAKFMCVCGCLTFEKVEVLFWHCCHTISMEPV